MTVWEGHMFGQHFQTTIARYFLHLYHGVSFRKLMCPLSLLLANFTQSSRIKHTLHLPFGPMLTPAVTDVQDLGYSIPSSAIFRDPVLSDFVQPEVADALLALTALYNTSTAIESLPHTHGGPQAREAVKISLRLARCSDRNIDSSSWRTQFAECVRFTALLFTWSFGRNVDSQKNDSIASARRHNRAFLTALLIECVLERADGSRAVYDFLLWMLIVCGSTTPLSDDRAYFATLVRSFFPDSGRWGIEHVRGLGVELPWIEIGSDAERPQDAFWRYVMDPRVEAESRKSEPLLLGYVGVTPGLKERLERSGKIEKQVLLTKDGDILEA